jgi:acyl-CoA thioester hydrolase
MTKNEPQPSAAPDPAGGWIEQRSYIFPVRVYYEDTDFSGFVYHASYLRFMERGRSEFLQFCGRGHQTLLNAAEPLFWTVRAISIEFIRPARVEDALHVRTTIKRISGARMFLDQLIARAGELVTSAEVEVCLINSTGRPRRIPENLRKQLEFYVQS